MIREKLVEGAKRVSHVELIDLLNQDLSREYQAIIAYVVYSQVLKGAEYTYVAGVLEEHVIRELNHAVILGEQVDRLTCMALKDPITLRTSKKTIEMLQLERSHEAEISRNYRERISQCEALAEYAICEKIREILTDKQIHQKALETALSKNASIQFPTM